MKEQLPSTAANLENFRAGNSSKMVITNFWEKRQSNLQTAPM
jgi:hypothetical protein